MVLAGADRLSEQAELINALNVFPVPDGDTGTNMNLTMTAGVAELKNKPSPEIGRAAEVLSKGLLMGARGNSLLRRYLGSVSSTVVAESLCTVTVVRATAPVEGDGEAKKAVAETSQYQ